MLDTQYDTLLFAIGLSSLGLAAAMFGTWLTRRSERFMLTWTVGVVLLAGAVVTFSYYSAQPSSLLALAPFGLLGLSLSVLYAAARQFRLGGSAIPMLVKLFTISMLLVAPPFILGFDGIGSIVGNGVAAVLLFLTAGEYWLARREASVPLITMSLLYASAAASFLLCAAVLIGQGQLVLSAAPANWAEDLNLYVSVVGVTGIGALSLALNQSRLARRHEFEANTDDLTGLLNRRAVFERYGRAAQLRGAVVLIDLDHFKTINDTHGHETGDAVLREFGELVRKIVRAGDSAARIGGEEFVLVLPDSTLDGARDVAERLRVALSAATEASTALPVGATVSAGVAMVDESGFEAALSAADAALYRAKDLGRDKVVVVPPRLAA